MIKIQAGLGRKHTDNHQNRTGYRYTGGGIYTPSPGLHPVLFDFNG